MTQRMNYMLLLAPETEAAALRLVTRLVTERIQFSFTVQDGAMLVSYPDTERLLPATDKDVHAESSCETPSSA